MVKGNKEKTKKQLRKEVEATQLDPIKTMADVIGNLETQLKHYRTMVIKAEGALEVVRQLQPQGEVDDS